MTILITDDEAPARGELRYLLETLVPSATLHEARNGEEALEFLEKHQADVIFLDINMPGLNGLSVATVLSEKENSPIIVFATAYDQHAVEAFELAALDYVVKPFDENRLAKTLERINQAVVGKEEQQNQLEKVRTYLKKAKVKLSKLWAERENENRILLDYSDIYWLEAEEKKVFAYTHNEKLLVRYTLKELEELLQEEPFARVHKASIISLNHIAEVVPWFSGNYMVRMKNATRTEVKMSRRYAVQLKELTGWR